MKLTDLVSIVNANTKRSSLVLATVNTDRPMVSDQSREDETNGMTYQSFMDTVDSVTYL